MCYSRGGWWWCQQRAKAEMRPWATVKLTDQRASPLDKEGNGEVGLKAGVGSQKPLLPERGNTKYSTWALYEEGIVCWMEASRKHRLSHSRKVAMGTMTSPGQGRSAFRRVCPLSNPLLSPFNWKADTSKEEDGMSWGNKMQAVAADPLGGCGQPR